MRSISQAILPDRLTGTDGGPFTSTLKYFSYARRASRRFATPEPVPFSSPRLLAYARASVPRTKVHRFKPGFASISLHCPCLQARMRKVVCVVCGVILRHRDYASRWNPEGLVSLFVSAPPVNMSAMTYTVPLYHSETVFFPVGLAPTGSSHYADSP